MSRRAPPRRRSVALLLVALVAGVAVALVAAVLLPRRGTAADGGYPFVRSVRGAQATVWAVGDGADGGRAGRAVAGRIAAGGVDRLLYLGDVYEHGTAKQFRTNYATTFGSL